LEEIWRYTFEQWSVAQADAYHNDLIGIFNELVSDRHPARQLIVSGRTYHRCPAGSHTIFFREETTRILIVRILHNRMDPARHL